MGSLKRKSYTCEGCGLQFMSNELKIVQAKVRVGKKKKSQPIVNIVQRRPDGYSAGFCRFRIIKTEKEYRLVVVEQKLLSEDYDMINFQISEGQVKRIGSDVSKYFNLKAKEAEFIPTLHDFEVKLKEKYGEEGFDIWIMDYLRFPGREELANRIYEWLKGAKALRERGRSGT